MAYNPNIPLANEKLSQSQPNILNNFIAIGNVLNPDNGTIKLPIQGAAQGTAAGQISLYSKMGTTIQSLFWREANNGAEHDMTSCLAAVNGWTMLPSGIILQWGSNSTNGTAGKNITFNLSPFPHSVFTVNVSSNGANTAKDVFMVTATTINGFTIASRTWAGSQGLTTQPFFWFAIGN
jgi:hypothetical protein